MPTTVRIMNWNIQTLSGNKVAIAGIATNIGKIIATGYNPGGGGAVAPDIVLILEISAGTAIAVMTAVSAAASAASVALGGNANDYTGWLLSYDTGGECYGVLIRNLNTVRPIQVTGGPTGADGYGVAAALSNLDQNQFGTWPGTFAGVANAYLGLPLPAARPRLPLTDVYASNPPVGRKRAFFAGRVLGAGGYALGNGFRMPCLAMFEVIGGGGPAASHLLPILACHLGAVRGGANALARGQIAQYKDTHIAQKFRSGGYIDLNNAAFAVQELVVTGDFNVDFLQNAAAGTAMQTGNHAALLALTPTVQNAATGSTLPAAAPGVPGGVPMVPFAMPVGGWPAGPIHTAIPNLALRTANTAQGTMLVQYAFGVVPANTVAMRDADFDNFFYGGTELSANTVLLGPNSNPVVANDACFIHDVPAQIVLPAAVAAATLNLSGAYLHYLLAGTHNAAAVPALFGGFGALAMNDRLIGARFISDHLPVVMRCDFA
jgi:hypothetical protein